MSHIKNGSLSKWAISGVFILEVINFLSGSLTINDRFRSDLFSKLSNYEVTNFWSNRFRRKIIRDDIFWKWSKSEITDFRSDLFSKRPFPVVTFSQVTDHRSDRKSLLTCKSPILLMVSSAEEKIFEPLENGILKDLSEISSWNFLISHSFI